MGSTRSRGGYTYEVDEKGNPVAGSAKSNANTSSAERRRDGTTYYVDNGNPIAKNPGALTGGYLNPALSNAYMISSGVSKEVIDAVNKIRNHETEKSIYAKLKADGYIEEPADTSAIEYSGSANTKPNDDGNNDGGGNVYGFSPSQTYLDAMAYTQSLLDKLNSGRTSYTDKINDIMAQIEGRQPFSYDFNTDTMFQQQLQSAMASGKLAMQDTMGQASALTGGYGSTYAQAVGNQAYNQQIQGAYDNLPDYYGMALDAYNAEGNALATKLGMYQTADDAEYSRLANAYALNVQNAANIYDQEYNNYWQGVSSEQSAAKSILENQQFYDKLAAQYGVGYDSNGNLVQNTSYAEPSTTQYSKALDAYNKSPNAFYTYLDSLPSDTDIDAIMDYVTSHGNEGMSLAYNDWQTGKDTRNWGGDSTIDNNDTVSITNADGSVTKYTLKELYKALVKAGMSEDEAKAYVMQYNGNK